jgi:site-specific DNA-methyltransferase (adenine-specific)
MSEVSDGSVHLVVTSPPYVTSKFKKGQPFDYDGYLNMVRDVFREVYRVLCADGRFCLNVGDVHTKYYYRGEDRFYRLPVGSNLLQMCLDLNFRLLDTFIWDKGFNRHKGGAAGPFFGSYPYPATIYNNVYWEYVFVLVKPGPKRKVPQETKQKSKLPLEKWRKYVQKIWRVESETEWIKEHPSVFPVEIPVRFIEMYSFAGDTVLDPFLGSGTTTLAARLTGRNSIGYEINPKYLDLIKRRVKMHETTLTDDKDEFEIKVRDDAREAEWI